LKFYRTISGLLLLPTLAFVGFLLMYLPSVLLRQYEVVSQAGTVWVVIYFGIVGLGGSLLLGCTLWIVWQLWQTSSRKKERRQRRGKDPSQLSQQEQTFEVDENIAAIGELRADPHLDANVLDELQPLVAKLEEKREAQTLEIVAFGTISSGKSSLLNALAGRDVFMTDARGGTTVRRNEVPWPGADKITLVDTPGLGEIEGEINQNCAADAAQDADIVLVVVDGPIRNSEHQLLEQLGQMEKRVLLCLNKLDWYSTQDRAALLGQIVEQVKEFVQAEDVVAVQARESIRERVRVLADGSELREQVETPASIESLADRLLKVFKSDSRDLLMANLLLQSRGLVEHAREKARESLNERAWKIVDRYMWGAGGAAALSPFPVLDLAAGTAISVKMVLDLGRVYRQDIDVQTAVKLVGELGKNLFSILGATAVTPLISSMLKGIPGIGTLAGGAMQGLVQILITRWIGAVFIEYFSHEMNFAEGGMTAVARRQWEHVTSISELKKLVDMARRHFAHSDETDTEQ